MGIVEEFQEALDNSKKFDIVWTLKMRDGDKVIKLGVFITNVEGMIQMENLIRTEVELEYDREKRIMWMRPE